MDEYWFEPRPYGYGAVPIHWKGAVLGLAFVFGVVVGTLCIGFTAEGAWRAILTPG